MFSARLNPIRFCGLLLLNVAVAVIGTAILEATLWRTIPAHTVISVFWKETALSIICAAFIGFGMWWRWQNKAAKWTWILPLLWFAFGLLVAAGHGIWGPLSARRISDDAAAEMRSFALFTIPLIRSMAYSLGAYISSFIYPSSVASVQ